MTETVKKQDGMAKLTILLCLITSVTTLLLALVNQITSGPIALINAEKTAASMREVRPDAPADWEFPRLDDSSIANSLVKGVFDGADGGYVVQVEPSGFGGAINMVVGVSSTGQVTGVSIINMSETSGLGDTAKQPSFTNQFLGVSSRLTVDKDGGTVDSLTGATVTSRAVTSGVNAALEAFASLN